MKMMIGAENATRAKLFRTCYV